MKNYKIDKTKNIGNVIFVVEGGRAETGGAELRLLKKVFVDIMGYEIQELRRGSEEFIGHGMNSSSCVFALNLPKNQLTELTEDAVDELFCRLKEEFKLKPEDCPVFFLYDRDVLSYSKNELRGKYVRKYTDPYGTAEGNQGQLLLSYPSIESFLLSCIKDESVNVTSRLGRDAKILLAKELCSSEDENTVIDVVFTKQPQKAEERLVHAIQEMDNGLRKMGVHTYDLDKLESTLLEVYDYQQRKYNEEITFSFLSLAGMALLELGVIVESEDEDVTLD